MLLFISCIAWSPKPPKPDALRYALTIFSYSHFLADAVIRYPEWLLEIAAARDLHRGFSPNNMKSC
jgi:hypothetical protein